MSMSDTMVAATATATRTDTAGATAIVGAHGAAAGAVDEEATPVRRRRRRYWMAVRMLAAVVAFLLVGNLGILAAHLWLQRQLPAAAVTVAGVKNFTVVDDTLWRGSAPSAAGYDDLAALGVTTVIDLRAERGIEVDEARLAELGLTRIHLPLRDGQSPSPAFVDRFLAAVDASAGRVYVHCGAGVGRTGTVAAAYLVERRGTGAWEAVRRNLAVGPPSLEQVVFAARLRPGDIDRPSAFVTGLSRLLDGPRRIWVHVRGSYTKA